MRYAGCFWSHVSETVRIFKDDLMDKDFLLSLLRFGGPETPEK
jgi:hypothetical protein